MKSFKSILAILAIFAIAASSSFAANKFAVKGTEYTDFRTALAAATSGDTVDITAYDTQIDGTNGITLNGINLVCSAATQAVIKFTAADQNGGYADNCYINATNATIRNIKFVGPDTAVAGALYANGTIVVDNCVIDNFKNRGIWGIHSDGTPLDLTVAKTFVTNINGSGLSFWHPGPVTTSAKVMLNHCTFYVSNADSPIIDIPGSWFADGNKGSDFTVKNSAFARSTFGGTVYNCGNDYATQKLDMLPINHTCNAYLGKSWQGATYDTHQVNGDWIFGPLPTDATDIVDLGNHEISQFVDAANGNFLLKKTTRLNGNADDGGNIGADQTDNGQVLGDVIVRQDGNDGAKTTLAEAVAACPGSGIIQIQQFTAPFEISDNLYLDNKSLVTATGVAGQKATIRRSNDGGFINLGNGGRLEGVILAGDMAKNQSGVNMNMSGQFTVKNCEIKNMRGEGMKFLWNGTDNPITGTIENTLFVNATVFLDDYQNSTNFGDVTFNHCTFVSYAVTAGTETFTKFLMDFYSVYIDAGGTGANVTIKNSILNDSNNHYRGMIIAEGFTGETLGLKLTYNDYIHPVGTNRLSWDHGNKGENAPLGTGELDNVDPKFVNESNGDYRLYIDTTAVGDKGEGGTYMGAYAPVEKPTAAKGWTIYN